MSKHKFTADRSDMAHQIKRALLGSTAVQPPPVVEDPMHRLLMDGEVFIMPRNSGKTEAALREMISNPKVEIKEKPRGA